MLGMVVRGDRLFAAVCVALCYRDRAYSGDAEYETLAVDLRTRRATVLRTPPSGSLNGKNPPIRNVDTEIFLR